MKNRTKHMSIDVLSVMTDIVDSHVKHYKNDFDIDTETIKEAALKPERTDRSFVWLCRECGTWLLRERNVFINDTRENSTFRFYAEQTHDEILCFVVEVDGFDGDTLKGNIYCLSYPEYYKHVCRTAVSAGSIVITYEHGQKAIPPTQRFTAYPDYVLGGFEAFEFQPESPEQLECVLADEKRIRSKFKEDYKVLGDEIYECPQS